VLHVFSQWNWPGLEGQDIAVWVHSNLDRVELLLNGQSLGAKDVQKDQHLAWLVKYVASTIELALTRRAPPRRGGVPPPAATTEARPAIGPPPNGTDPSLGAGFGGRRGGAPAPLVLRQVKR
jgi:hypothetical protein